LSCSSFDRYTKNKKGRLIERSPSTPIWFTKTKLESITIMKSTVDVKLS
jgi:hypothetical protein